LLIPSSSSQDTSDSANRPCSYLKALSRPGGNVTGMTNFMNVLGASRLELGSEAVPTAVVLGSLVNPTNPSAEADTRGPQAAAQAILTCLMWMADCSVDISPCSPGRPDYHVIEVR
jgi:hypothetical protein